MWNPFAQQDARRVGRRESLSLAQEATLAAPRTASSSHRTHPVKEVRHVLILLPDWYASPEWECDARWVRASRGLKEASPRQNAHLELPGVSRQRESGTGGPQDHPCLHVGQGEMVHAQKAMVRHVLIARPQQALRASDRWGDFAPLEWSHCLHQTRPSPQCQVDGPQANRASWTPRRRC